MSKQTAVEWLFRKLWDEPKDKLTWCALLKLAKEKESEVSISQKFCDYVNSSLRVNILDSFDNQWYCVIVSVNGQVLFTSETYKRKASIKKMLKNNFPNIKIV
jgi:uncharacterized protein YegP (UPF0339 family)